MAPKFKNIRIKMANGKTRLQRVRVLASGKLKFVKNVKKAGRATRKVATRVTGRNLRRAPRRRFTSRSGGNRTASKKARKIPIFSTIGGGLGAGITLKKVWDARPKAGGSVQQMGDEFIHALFGYWIPEKKFKFENGGGMGLGLPLAGGVAGQILKKVSPNTGSNIPFISLR